MVLAFLCAGSLRASHIVGGEIYYDYLGADNYRVTLKLYRDCNGIRFDGDPAGTIPDLGLYIFDGNNVLLDSIAVPFPGENQVPAGLNYLCYQPPPNICVREAIYQTIVSLPLNSAGYRLVYQRCCRNATIVNLVSPGSLGATYEIFVPSRINISTNNSPRYKNFPPVFICANVPLVFDHSATDLDGDSLVYSLCDAYQGATSSCPYYSPGFLQGGCPSSPPPPPFNYVNYSAGYSGAYPLSANPALSIDPQTGLLTGTPDQLGQWVVAVCVSEYRNGVLISVNKRDFQFNVVNCISNIVAAIPTQTLFCNGYIVSFGNNSINANSYFWDFGVPSLTNDTSNFSTPTYAFPDSGNYTVTLIANPGLPCADTAYELVKVYPLLDPTYTAPPPECIQGNSFDFSAGGVFTSDATFFWNFGAGAVPQTSTSQNPTNVVYNTPGTYNVVLTVSQYGCSEPVVKQLTVGAMPDPLPAMNPQYCGGTTVLFDNNSTNGTNYIWNFGDPSSTSNMSGVFAPTHVFTDTGYFNVSLLVTNALCRDSDTIAIHVIPQLAPDFTAPTIQCLSTNNFSFQAGGSYYEPEAIFAWDFGPGASPSTSNDKDPTGISFSTPGIHNVTLGVSQRSCAEVVTKQVEVLQDPVAEIQPLPPYCGGFDFQFTNMSSFADSYHWNFGVIPITSDTSSVISPMYTYSDTGYFNVQLSVSSRGICFDSTNLQVHVFPQLDPQFVIPTKQCFDGNSFAFNAAGVFQQGAQVTWNFGSSAVPSVASGVNVSGIEFNTPGTKNVTLTISQYGCTDSINQAVRVLDEPIAVIDSQNVFCNGYSYDFGNSSQFSDAWSWNFGVVPIATDTSFRFEPSYTYADSGSYNVTLIASNEGLCFDTTSMLFYIYPLLSPEILVNDPEQCIEGNIFNFTLGGTYSPLTNFLWNFGPNSTPDTSILRNPVPVSYSSPGDYSVTLYAFENGCNKSVQRNVHVFPLPGIDFTASGVGCSPLEVSFLDNSFAETEIFYNWNFGDGASSSQKDPVHSYAQAGVYDVSLTIRTDSGCVDTLTKIISDAITVYQSPVAGFSIDSLGSLEVDPTIIVTDQSVYAYGCSLDFGNGFTTSACDTTYTLPDTGTYKITQIVYTLEGCSDTMVKVVRIPPVFRLYVANAFSPNGDGRNDEFMPVILNAKSVQFDVYNRWGELIFEGAKDQAWDGRYKGRFVQEDVYVYRVHVIDVFDQSHVVKGHVTVVK